MTNLDSVLESKDRTLPTKVCIVKAMLFPGVMYECESRTIKKAEHWRIDAFELWCWRKLLRVPWTARRPNQSIVKEISPEYSLEGLMLKLQYFGHLMWRTDSLQNTCAGKDWRQEKKGTTEDEMAGWHHWLDGHEFEQALGVGDGQGGLVCYSPWVAKSWTWLDTTEQLNNSSKCCGLTCLVTGLQQEKEDRNEVWCWGCYQWLMSSLSKVKGRPKYQGSVL